MSDNIHTHPYVCITDAVLYIEYIRRDNGLIRMSVTVEEGRVGERTIEYGACTYAQAASWKHNWPKMIFINRA